MRILITVPDLKRHGGVSALFNILKMEEYYSNISLFILHNRYPFLIRIIIKYITFIFKLPKVDVVHINPSLDQKSFIRDAIFAWISLFFSKKLIVYWHGWDDNYEEKIKGSSILTWIAKHSFFKAHLTIVLGNVFMVKLRNMGYKKIIYVETNTAENKYIKSQYPKTINPKDQIRLLFMSRLEVEKGIYIAIKTLEFLNKKTKQYELIIAGTGSEEEKIKLLANKNKEIVWKGYVFDESKHELLNSVHIMFFPTYAEGLPLTLLEGMMYGLPIVTRPVGGIPDIIENGINGFTIDNLSPEENAKKISEIVNTPGLYHDMSNNNLVKNKLFQPQVVRERIYSYYEELVGKNK